MGVLRWKFLTLKVTVGLEQATTRPNAEEKFLSIVKVLFFNIERNIGLNSCLPLFVCPVIFTARPRPHTPPPPNGPVIESDKDGLASLSY